MASGALDNLPVDDHPDRFWIVSVVPDPGGGRGFVAAILTKDLGGNVTESAPTREAAIDDLPRLFAEFALAAGVRPGTIATDDAEVGRRLREALGAAVAEAEILVIPHLPMLEAVVGDMASEAVENEMAAGPLTGEGMTVERLRSYAAAAADFYRAAPWNHLNGDDLIQVESPKCPGGQKYVVVMGSGGETFGLAFYKSRQQLGRSIARTMSAGGGRIGGRGESLFGVVFWGPDGVWPGDVRAWEDHGLPVAGPRAYPMAAYHDPGSGEQWRADAASVAHAEGLMRGLAATTEDELDAGRWTKRVATADGAVEYTLALPDLLKAMAKPRRRAKISPDRPDAMLRVLERAMAKADPAEELEGPLDPNDPQAVRRRAMDLLDAAAGAVGRRRVQLARQALKLDPDAADAWCLMAGHGGDPAWWAGLYAKGVEAGRRALGGRFDEFVGHFWGVLETRPFMRAMVGLAVAKRETGEEEAALELLREMLRLNPEDNQGARDLVAACLFALGRDAEVLEHLARWGDGQAISAYARALGLFRVEGDSAGARAARAEAVAGNRHVPGFLARGAPPDADWGFGWTPGEPSEAAYAEAELGEAWRATPGALRWLAAAVPPPAARGGRKRRRR